MEACAQCNKRGDANSIRRCSRCKSVRYCSSECQRRHWVGHKATCKRLEETFSSTLPKQAAAEASGGCSAVKTEDKSNGNIPLWTCNRCGRQGHEMEVCRRCRTVRYCSNDCRRGDWRAHRITCSDGSSVTEDAMHHHQQQPAQRKPAPMEKNQQPSTHMASNPWNRLLSTLHENPWHQARAKALQAFPSHRIVDIFEDLEMTFEEKPHFLPRELQTFLPSGVQSVEGTGRGQASLVRLKGQVWAPVSLVSDYIWRTEDIMREDLLMTFDMDAFDDIHLLDLQPGDFLCVRDPVFLWQLLIDNTAVHFANLCDRSSVRVFKR